MKSQTTGEYTRTDAVERKSCIDLVNDVDNATIEFNYCENGGVLTIGAYNYDCPGECNQYADNYTIRYNILKNTIFAINAAGNHNMTGYGSFYGNLLMECYVSWGGNDFNSKSHKIYNNTIYVTTTHGVYHTDACYNQENVEFKNNIIYQNGASAGYFNIKDQSDCMVPSQKSNNLYYRKIGTTAVDGGASDYTIAQIAAGLYDTNAKTIDPFFTGGDLPTGFTNNRPNTNYFLPETGSLAYYNGTATLTPTVDIRGYPYSRSSPAIGAYERILGNPANIGAVGATARPGVGAAATIGN
ncbi:MAG: hypothetical protein LLG40_09895 [Deltaproteobacteria bacterium]|nr:hypothetical protein [Deltaproteobacteria bacterium]